MDAESVRVVHRYGALLSVLAVVAAVVASVVGGPFEPLVLALGFFGPLCGFYFVGGALVEHARFHVLGEELMRGVVWYGGSLLGWSFILTSSSALQATPATALGLPALTALGISLLMVGVREATGLDLKVQTEGGQLLTVVTGAVVGAFIVLYVILVDGRSPLLGLLYALATAGGVLVWQRRWTDPGGGG